MEKLIARSEREMYEGEGIPTKVYHSRFRYFQGPRNRHGQAIGRASHFLPSCMCGRGGTGGQDPVQPEEAVWPCSAQTLPGYMSLSTLVASTLGMESCFGRPDIYDAYGNTIRYTVQSDTQVCGD